MIAIDDKIHWVDCEGCEQLRACNRVNITHNLKMDLCDSCIDALLFEIDRQRAVLSWEP